MLEVRVRVSFDANFTLRNFVSLLFSIPTEDGAYFLGYFISKSYLFSGAGLCSLYNNTTHSNEYSEHLNRISPYFPFLGD